MNRLLIIGAALLFLMSPGYSQTTVLVDDFDDLSMKDSFGGEWKPEDDSSQGGDSSAFVTLVGGRQGSKGALRLDYTLGPRFAYRYSTVSLVYPGARDWAQYSGIRFWMRGSGDKMRIEIGTEPVKDGDFHAYTISETTTEWKEYVVPFSVLKQGNYGRPIDFNPGLVHRLYVVASSSVEGEKGFIELDDIFLEQHRNDGSGEPAGGAYVAPAAGAPSAHP